MLCLLCNIPLRNAHCTIAIFEWNLLSGVLALCKVAVGIKVLPESEDVALPQLPMAMELSQRHKNRYTIRMFSEGLLGFEPIQGATPFSDTDMMDLPLTELKEMPRAAHALFPLLPPVGMSGPHWEGVGGGVSS